MECNDDVVRGMAQDISYFFSFSCTLPISWQASPDTLGIRINNTGINDAICSSVPQPTNQNISSVFI
jgi:hypothetical protein